MSKKKQNLSIFDSCRWPENIQNAPKNVSALFGIQGSMKSWNAAEPNLAFSHIFTQYGTSQFDTNFRFVEA